MKKGLSGAKPKDFCFWLFEVLGMEKEDTLDDLFPGTGIVTELLKEWKGNIINKDVRHGLKQSTKLAKNFKKMDKQIDKALGRKFIT